jgi:hypothetical protein
MMMKTALFGALALALLSFAPHSASAQGTPGAWPFWSCSAGYAKVYGSAPPYSPTCKPVHHAKAMKKKHK